MTLSLRQSKGQWIEDFAAAAWIDWRCHSSWSSRKFSRILSCFLGGRKISNIEARSRSWDVSSDEGTNLYSLQAISRSFMLYMSPSIKCPTAILTAYTLPKNSSLNYFLDKQRRGQGRSYATSLTLCKTAGQNNDWPFLKESATASLFKTSFYLVRQGW